MVSLLSRVFYYIKIMPLRKLLGVTVTLVVRVCSAGQGELPHSFHASALA